jgi:multiple sugar transport system substrate-binding protein
VGIRIGSKRGVACLGAAVVVAVGAAACGGGGNGSASKGSSGGKVTLTWWDYVGDSPAATAAITGVLRRYEASHPNVTIKRTSLGYADMHTKLVQAMATGKMPDVAVIDNVDLPVFVAQGGLADLTPKMNAWATKSQFYPNILKPIDGKYYAMPYRSNDVAFIYNKDMLKEAAIDHPPTTWEELRADAKKLTTGDRAGYCFSAFASGEGDFQFLPFLWQAGGDLNTLGDAASIKALTFLNTLVNVDKSAPKSVVSWTQPEMASRFIAKQCAMMQNGPWELQPLMASKINFGVSLLPKDVDAVTVQGGENIVASKKAPLDTVWDLLTWMQKPENITKDTIVGLGMLPNRTDQFAESKWFWAPEVKPFAEQLKVARSRQYGPKYAEVQPKLWDMVQQVLTGKQTPEQAAKATGSAIKPLLAGQ